MSKPRKTVRPPQANRTSVANPTGFDWTSSEDVVDVFIAVIRADLRGDGEEPDDDRLAEVTRQRLAAGGATGKSLEHMCAWARRRLEAGRVLTEEQVAAALEDLDADRVRFIVRETSR